MIDPRIKEGSVVQIDPEFQVNPAFRACMMTVSELKSWGVQGYVQALGDTREKGGGQAYIRCKWNEIAYVGEAVWVAGSLTDDKEE